MSSRSEILQSIDSMKKKNCWKISNRSSIPLTIHATESIIQLQSRSFASPRSQETRIEFASRGRDPDLSSLIDGTRETGGGIGRDEEVLSFFFLAWNNRHGFRVSLLRESRSADSLRCLHRDPRGLHAKNTYYHANLFFPPLA